MYITLNAKEKEMKKGRLSRILALVLILSLVIPSAGPGFTPVSAADKSYNIMPQNVDALKHLEDSDFYHGIFSVYMLGCIRPDSESTVKTISAIKEVLDTQTFFDPGTGEPIDLHFFLYDVWDSYNTSVDSVISSTFGGTYSDCVHVANSSNSSKYHTLIDKLEPYFYEQKPLVEFITPDGEPYYVHFGYMSASEISQVLTDMASVQAKKAFCEAAAYQEQRTITYTLETDAGSHTSHTLGNNTGKWADKVGQTITFGTYAGTGFELNSDDMTVYKRPNSLTSNSFSRTSRFPVDITWKILSTDGDTAMLISTEAIEYRPFRAALLPDPEVTWKNSMVRSYLNGYGKDSHTAAANFAEPNANFINLAFTAEEQEVIYSTHIENDPVVCQGFDIPGESGTVDKIFLLSLEEYCSSALGFDPNSRSADSSRIVNYSAFVESEQHFRTPCSELLTRSAGAFPSARTCIDDNGEIDLFAQANIERKIQPVIFISISAYEEYISSEHTVTIPTSHSETWVARRGTSTDTDLYRDALNLVPEDFDPIIHLNDDNYIAGIYSVYIYGSILQDNNVTATMRAAGEFLHRYCVKDPVTNEPIDVHFFIYDDIGTGEVLVSEAITNTLGTKYSSRLHIADASPVSSKYAVKKYPLWVNQLENPSSYGSVIRFITPDRKLYSICNYINTAESFYDILTEEVEWYYNKENLVYPTELTEPSITSYAVLNFEKWQSWMHTLGSNSGTWAGTVGQTITFGSYMSGSFDLSSEDAYNLEKTFTKKEPSTGRITSGGTEYTGINRSKPGSPTSKAKLSFSETKPLEWVIISADDNTALLMAAQAVDYRPYYATISSDLLITWNHSTIRSWLNGYKKVENFYADYSPLYTSFINSAFTKSERSLICTTDLYSPDIERAGYSIPGGPKTYDKIFILSLEEYSSAVLGYNTNYHEPDPKRVTAASDYVSSIKKQYDLPDTGILTRSTGASNIHTAYITSDGSIDLFGYENEERAVVPVMFIDIDLYEKYAAEHPERATLPTPAEPTPTPTPTPTPPAPSKQTISSVSSKEKGKLTVKWKKNTKADGYQIQYGTKSDFSGAKSASVTKNTTTSKTISSLSTGKTYYVRVRSYILLDDGSKLYGKWSDKKSVKIAEKTTSSKKSDNKYPNRPEGAVKTIESGSYVYLVASTGEYVWTGDYGWNIYLNKTKMSSLYAEKSGDYLVFTQNMFKRRFNVYGGSVSKKGATVAMYTYDYSSIGNNEKFKPVYDTADDYAFRLQTTGGLYLKCYPSQDATLTDKDNATLFYFIMN